MCVNITWSQGQDRSHPNGWALKPVQLLSFFFCYIKSYKMFVENDDLLRDNPVFTDASLLCRVISFFLLRKSTKEKRNETTARVRLFWIVFPFLISCFHPQWPSKRQTWTLNVRECWMFFVCIAFKIKKKKKNAVSIGVLMMSNM